MFIGGLAVVIGLGFVSADRFADISFANAGATYYVARDSGADDNPGSLEEPFQTIQRCADELPFSPAGSRCVIRAGTYPETVEVKSSGQAGQETIFEAYPGETVTVTGRERITSAWEKVAASDYPWLPAEHNVYRTVLENWDFDRLEGMDFALPGSGQLFVEDEPYQMAAEPDLPPNYMASMENWAEHDPRVRNQSQIDQGLYPDWVSHAKNRDPQDSDEFGNPFKNEFELTSKSPLLDKPAGYWDEGLVNFISGQRWDVFTGRILDSEEGRFRLSIGAYSNNMFFPISLEGRHYVWNTPKALTSEGEWAWETNENAGSVDTTVLFWAPAGQDPNLMRISAKKRTYGFDFQDHDHIVLDGINLDTTTTISRIAYNTFNNSVFLNRLNVNEAESSSHVTLRNFRARYPSHLLYNRANYRASAVHNANTGIMLHGVGHTIENCYVTYSSGNGIILNGADGVLRDCLVSQTGYGGNDTGGIRTGGLHHEVHHNTVWNTGRHAYLYGNIGSNVNFIHPTSGSVYGLCTADSRFHHNVGYNAGAQGSNDLGVFYGWNGRDDCHGLEIDHNVMYNTNVRTVGHAIYLDNNTTDALVHHNVSWGSQGLRLNFENKRNQVYHNTDIAVNKQGPPNVDLYNFGSTSADKHYVQNNIFTTEPELYDCDPSSAPGEVFSCSPSPCESYGEYVPDPDDPNETVCQPSENGTRFELANNRLVDWQAFVQPEAHDYGLRETASLYRDGGSVLTGSRYGYDLASVQANVTDGAPDIGAYEYAQPPWVAGTRLFRHLLRESIPECRAASATLAACRIPLPTRHLLLDSPVELKIGANSYADCVLDARQLDCADVPVTDSGDQHIYLRFENETIPTNVRYLE